MTRFVSYKNVEVIELGMRKIVKILALTAVIVYSFEKGYKEGYKKRDNKYPEW